MATGALAIYFAGFNIHLSNPVNNYYSYIMISKYNLLIVSRVKKYRFGNKAVLFVIINDIVALLADLRG